MKNLLKTAACFLFLICGVSSLFAEVHSFGGKIGWSEVNVRNGITTGKGRFGYESLTLDTDNVRVQDGTDMLLTFENGRFVDETGNYKVIENKLFQSSKAIIGKSAALSRNKSGGLVLDGVEGSFFNTEGPAGSFLIDFWLCPSVVENGEIILNWRSSRNTSTSIMYQLITASLYQDKLMIIFSNIFDGYTKENEDVILLGVKKLIPNKWTHHSIIFEEDTGALLYKLDGELEDIKFITSTKHENGTVYQAIMGVQANVEICPSYSGLIDNFRVMRSYANIQHEIDAESADSLNPKLFNTCGGRFESVPVLTKAGSIFKKLKAQATIPEQTAVQYYIRTGDNCYNWTNDYPAWKKVESGEEISNVTGLYFQVAAELFPDGAGKVSPYVSEITVEYETLPEPQPPYRISAAKGDGSVTLTWSYSVDDTAGGYYIYYGTRPGEYLGRIANEGNSPINAGNTTSYTITGLKNGTIYYFAVSAWSKIDNRICGPLSKEVYARPGVSDGR